jgi:hypothetical protein
MSVNFTSRRPVFETVFQAPESIDFLKLAQFMQEAF